MSIKKKKTENNVFKRCYFDRSHCLNDSPHIHTNAQIHIHTFLAVYQLVGMIWALLFKETGAINAYISSKRKEKHI